MRKESSRLKQNKPDRISMNMVLSTLRTILRNPDLSNRYEKLCKGTKLSSTKQAEVIGLFDAV